jgi:excisionase family DNA binding protein
VSKLLDPDAAAEMMGVSRRWVMEAAKRDAIPHVRIGRFIRFDDEALQEWWRKRSRGPGR